MTRMHLHLSVDNLAESIRFHNVLFAAPPSMEKPDYAKWQLDDPRVNFAISTRGRQSGIDHVGIEAETPHELQKVYGRLAQAAAPVLDEGKTTCCYARSEKSWIHDPQGLRWEIFHTTGSATNYGSDDPAAGPRRACCA